MNHILVGTSRCDVPARAMAGGTVALVNAARTAQRAVSTGFMAPRFASKFWKCSLPLTPSQSPNGGPGGRLVRRSLGEGGRPGEGATYRIDGLAKSPR